MKKLFSRSNSTDDLSSSSELTDEDIAEMKQSVADELTPSQLEELDDILSKFKKGTSLKSKIDGMVCKTKLSAVKFNFNYNFCH